MNAGGMYKEIASVCLTEWYPKMSETERNDLLKKGDYEELEGYIYAEGSIKAAIRGLNLMVSKYFQWYLPAGFEDFVLYGTPLSREEGLQLVDRKESIAYSAPEVHSDIVIGALISIHDYWVSTNTKKFFDPSRQDRQYMFAHALMIGWKEVEKDLIFLKPIAEHLGLTLDGIESYYQIQAISSAEAMGLDSDNLAEFLGKGSEAYYALSDSISETLKHDPETCQRMATQIVAKGVIC